MSARRSSTWALTSRPTSTRPTVSSVKRSSQGGGWFHDGGTGGFTSFVAFHRPTNTAVGLIANGGNVAGLDRAGFATLTAMVHARA